MDPKRRLVIIMALITAVSLFGDSMLYVALPTHWSEAGLSSFVQVGVLLSINRFVRLPLNPIIGWAYRKISSRTGVFLAVFIAGSTTFLYGHVTNFYEWCLIRGLWGVAWSLLRLGSYFMILDLSTDENRGYYLGTYNGLYRIGSLVGMLSGGFFVDLYGLRGVTAVFGILAFLAAPLVLRFVPHTRHDIIIEKKRADKGTFLGNPYLLWVLSSVFLVAMSLEGILTSTLSRLIEMRMPRSIDLLGITLGAATLAGVLQATRWAIGPALSPFVGKLSDGRSGRYPLLALGLILISISMGLTQLSIFPFTAWLCVLLVILFISTALTTLMDALASDLAAGKVRVAVATVYVIVGDVGAACGPILAYAGESIFGIKLTYWISSIILLILGIVWSVMAYLKWKKEKQVVQTNRII
ncbi:MFS transporter [Paenibacillus cremeus]|uniref:MFS transporter n=1 Tax=Paenibacillus cremeus TaxID=2163881 RepID=A0A559K5X5_9BACL|nr:MFS transporter [Paenibacillus cremeus]TVY07541.1 MFS transporter [Paenibacillus cremeus]